MYLIKGIMGVIWFAVVPFLVGLLLTGNMKKNGESAALTLLCGYGIMFSVFEVMALPMIFLKCSFSYLYYSYSIIMAGMALIALVTERKRILPMSLKLIKSAKKLPWTCILAALLIAVQLGIYVLGMSTDLDDAFYVGTATTTLETNTMFQYSAYTGDVLRSLPSRYVLSPFPIMLAFFGKMIGMNPTIIAHTMMPVFFVSLAYMVYSLQGMLLFDKDKKSTGLFLCFLSIIHMFSYYSVYTQGTFMLIRIWQGKALLASMLLPFLFYFGIRVYTMETETGDWIALLSILGSCCLVSSMGIMLGPIMLGLLSIYYGVFKKKWRQLGRAVTCCIPSMFCAILYLMIR